MKYRNTGSIVTAGLLVALTLTVWSGPGQTADQKIQTQRKVQTQDIQAVDHYRCYNVDQHGQLPPQVAELKDQFQSDKRKVGRIRAICAPVFKRHNNRETKPRYPRVHLVCYDLDPKKSIGKDVEVRNQFGRARMTVAQEQMLCVPSYKRVLQP